MKELSIKEKAKVYDRALEIANAAYKDEDRHLKATLERIFPELIESEDDKIRKELLHMFDEQRGYVGGNAEWINGIGYDSVVAWLEKQGQTYTKKDVDDAYVEGIASAKNELKKQGKSELKDNKDEKIRKEIIETFKNLGDGKIPVDINYADIFTWLEKQGEQKLPIEKLPSEMKTIRESLEFTTQEECDEYNQIVSDCIMSDTDKSEQKPADKEEPKFKVGDCVVNPYGDVWHIDSLDGNIYQVSNKGKYNYFPIAKQDEMHLWTFADAKEGDVIVYKDEISLYKHDIKNCTKQETTFGGFVYYCCYDGKRFIMDSLYSLTEQDKPDIHPATKEQRDLLFQKMHEEGYEWDAEKKELRKIEFSDVGHEYYSELLKNDKSDNIADYAYQCAYCMSHDWIEENATWDNVQSACKLGAKWQKKHDVSEEWNEEDENTIKVLMNIIRKSEMIDSIIYTDSLKEKLYDWLKFIKDRIQPQLRQEWKQENTDDLTDFENAMMHIGVSFFGDNAGLDPNDTNTIRKQAKLLLELVPKQKWSEEDEHWRQKAIDFMKHPDLIKAVPTLVKDTIDWLKSLRPQNRWKVVDKGIYVKEPALAQKKDKSEPGQGFVVCYDHTLTPDVYERYIMLSDINCHSWWKPSDEQIEALGVATDICSIPEKQYDELNKLYHELKKLKGE